MEASLLIGIFQIVVLIYSVVLHEVAHGLAARSMGDQTAEFAGRLTLNPIKHLDPFGSVLLPILSSMATGFMFGYAKPVPYNPHNLSDKKYGPSKVAIAGPAVNIILAVLSALVIRFAGDMISPMAVNLISYIVWINLILAFFNIMPVPPLDGHWLLMRFLPGFSGLKAALYRYQLVFFALFVFFVFPLFSPVLTGAFTLLTGKTLF